MIEQDFVSGLPQRSQELTTSPVLTPSEQLTTRLFSRVMTPVEELSRLRGTKVRLLTVQRGMDEDDLIGTVVGVNGRDVSFLPSARIEVDDNLDEHTIPIVGVEPVNVPVYFVTNDPFEAGWVDKNDPEVAFAIFKDFPNRLHIWCNGYSQVSIDFSDPDLDNFLDQALAKFPVIKTTQDVASLTSFIRELIPYKEYENPVKKGIYMATKLGSDLSEHGSVCRHKAAVTMAVLELRGLHTKFVHNKGREDASHAYVSIESGLDGQIARIISDPTWGVSGTEQEVLSTLFESGLSLQFHLSENATYLDFEPDWAAV